MSRSPVATRVNADPAAAGEAAPVPPGDPREAAADPDRDTPGDDVLVAGGEAAPDVAHPAATDVVRAAIRSHARPRARFTRARMPYPAPTSARPHRQPSS